MKTSPWLIAGIVAVTGLAAYAVFQATKGTTPNVPPTGGRVDNTGKDILSAINTVGGLVSTIFGAFSDSESTTDKNPEVEWTPDGSKLTD